MKKAKKFSAFVIALLVLMLSVSTTAFAAEESQDGLVARLSSDKSSYSSDEEIKLNVSVQNKNDYDINNVTLELILPDGFKLKNEEALLSKISSLKAGDDLSSEVNVIKIQTEDEEAINPGGTGGGSNNQSGNQAQVGTTGGAEANGLTAPSVGNEGKGDVNTGNTPLIFIIAIALIISVAAIFIAYKYRKNAMRVLSVLLCVCMLFSAFTFATVSVKANNTEIVNKSFTVSCTIDVEGISKTIKLNVSYDIEQSIPDESDVPKVNGNSTANLQNGGTLTGQGDTIYYAGGIEGETIFSSDIEGGNRTEIIKENGVISDMNIIGDYLIYLVHTGDNWWSSKVEYGFASAAGEVVCLNYKTNEKKIISDQGNFPVVYEGNLYYLEKNGNYFSDDSSNNYKEIDGSALYDLYRYDFNDGASTFLKSDVYTLTLNDDKLIYGKLREILPVALMVYVIDFYDMNDKRVQSTGRMGHLSSWNDDRTACSYTIGDYTYETDSSVCGYVRRDKKGNVSKISDVIDSNDFLNAYSPFERLNYVYYNDDVICFIDKNNNIINGKYSDGLKRIVESASNYSDVGRLQIFDNRLYFLADGVLRVVDITSNTLLTSDEFEYTVDENNMATITDYRGNDTDVTIPAVIDGHSVLSVDAFLPGNFDSDAVQNIKSITVSEGIKYITDWTFEKCKALEKITIPSNIEQLATDWFSSSGENLREYNVSGSGGRYYSKDGILFDSERKMLMLCPKQKEFENGEYIIPDGIKEICGRAFYANKNIKRLVMPESVEMIGDFAFCECSEISEIVFSPNINMIMWAFNACSILKSVTIPRTMTDLDRSLLGFNYSDKIPGFTIYGYPGSEAESYAINNGFDFIDISNE